jgi:hypothetical protein
MPTTQLAAPVRRVPTWLEVPMERKTLPAAKDEGLAE